MNFRELILGLTIVMSIAAALIAIAWFIYDFNLSSGRQESAIRETCIRSGGVSLVINSQASCIRVPASNTEENK